MSHLSRHCRERLDMGATVDPRPLIAEVEYYEEQYRLAQMKLLAAHMLLARSGIDPATGGTMSDDTDQRLIYNTAGT